MTTSLKSEYVGELNRSEMQAILISTGKRIRSWNDDTGLMEDGDCRAILLDEVMGFTIPSRFDVHRKGPRTEDAIAFIPIDCRSGQRWQRFVTGTVYWTAEEDDITIIREKLWPGEVDVVQNHLVKLGVIELEEVSVKGILKRVAERRKDGPVW